MSPEQRQILKELKEDDSIIICPADKGKAVVVEDRETYLAKTQDQIHEGNYELSNKNEKTILRKLHRKIIDQLRDMGITEFKEQRRYTVTGPVMASMALLIKVHKQNFPGRAYVSQIDDPSYKVCEELTRILNPIDEKGDSFIRDTYHFKEMLDGIGIMKDDLMGTLDIVGMFPNIPVKKTLEVVREELLNDDTLGSRTKWEIDDILKLQLKLILKLWMGKSIFRGTAYRLERVSRNRWQEYTCIGSKRLTYLERMENLRKILSFGKGRLLTFSSYGGAQKRS